MNFQVINTPISVLQRIKQSHYIETRTYFKIETF